MAYLRPIILLMQNLKHGSLKTLFLKLPILNRLFLRISDVENLFITYAVCHLASMTSAISNPVLYGFMNENFRAEFRKIWRKLKKALSIRPGNRTTNTVEEVPLSSVKRFQPSEDMITVGQSIIVQNGEKSEIQEGEV